MLKEIANKNALVNKIINGKTGGTYQKSKLYANSYERGTYGYKISAIGNNGREFYTS